ncbi:MAG: hypothetical protein WBZ20_09285 [Nitrososphaeraceae archaeon]
MPISKIDVNEYGCIKYEYKWINRVNGKDGPVPKRCAKYKRLNWDRDEIIGIDEISPKENDCEDA